MTKKDLSEENKIRYEMAKTLYELENIMKPPEILISVYKTLLIKNKKKLWQKK